MADLGTDIREAASRLSHKLVGIDNDPDYEMLLDLSSVDMIDTFGIKRVHLYTILDCLSNAIQTAHVVRIGVE